MFRLLLICCVGLLLNSAAGQDFPQQQRVAEVRRMVTSGTRLSRSRQFIVSPPSETGWLPQLGKAPGLNIVRLDPGLLTVSCERIKESLLRRLDMKDNWRGKIYIALYPSRRLDDEIVVNSVMTGDEWSYAIKLPDTLDRQRFVAVIVEVLLQELANRHAAGRSAEIPVWLSQGWGQELAMSDLGDLILDPPDEAIGGLELKRVERKERMSNPLMQAHEQLTRNPPLTLAEMSWPREGQFSGGAADAFRSSAQLFVHELLQFRDGPACMRALLEQLPKHFNWQISFLNAFDAHFASQLELEKWWELKLANLSGRDLSQMWSREESRRRLDEVLVTQVQVRTTVTEMPMRSEVSLQTIIREWDLPRQSQVLQEKVQQLSMLRMKVSQDVIALADEYRQALEKYLGARQKFAGIQVVRGRSAPSLAGMIRDALRDLDALDARRAQLQEKQEISSSGKTETASLPRK